MKTCPSCGSQMPDEAVVCTVCGAQLNASQATQQQPYQQQPYQQQPYQQQPYQQQAYQQPVNYQQPYQQQMYPTSNPGDGKATGSLVLGILSIVFCSLLFGIIGCVLGVQARNVMPEGTPGRGKATAGLVCSIIGCVVGGMIVLCVVCSGGIGGAAACADSMSILAGLL